MVISTDAGMTVLDLPWMGLALDKSNNVDVVPGILVPLAYGRISSVVL